MPILPQTSAYIESREYAEAWASRFRCMLRWSVKMVDGEDVVRSRNLVD
jgi:hypothetical protein